MEQMLGTPRVLVLAELANPEWTSVPLVGWSLANALRSVASVHLVTQVRNRDAILRAGLVEGVDFTCIDSEAIARPMWAAAEKLRMGENRGWTTIAAMMALTYPYFEHLVWRQFGSRIEAGEFDIVHRVTPLSPTVSSLVAARCRRAGVPFVLGPINGGVPWPAEFRNRQFQEREWLSSVRGAYRWLPGRSATLEAADAIIVGSRHTESEIPSSIRERCVYLPENGVDLNRFTRRATPGDGPLAACFVGRLVPYKGLDMAIEAAAPMLADGRMTLDVVGDGPARAEAEAQAEALGVAGSVRFHGWLEHARVQDVLSKCEVLTFPSIREFGGGVVLEAMAVGVVPFVIDYAGPGELVTPTTGRAVPMGPREEIVADLRECLVAALDDRSSLRCMAAAARARVEDHFTWDRKAEQVAEVYRWVATRRRPPALIAEPA